MPAENKNGRGSSQKRSRSRALTPERSLRRRTRDQPPQKRRGLRSDDIPNERGRKLEIASDGTGRASTSRGGRQTRSRGAKRKASSIEPEDNEEIPQPKPKKQRVADEGRSSHSLSKPSEHDSMKKTTCSKDGEEEEEQSRTAEGEKKEEGDDEKETRQKRKEGDSKDGKLKKQDENKAQDKSNTEDEDLEEKEVEGEQKKEKENGEGRGKDDEGDTIHEDQGGESSSSENAASTETSKAGGKEGTSNSDGAGKSSKKERSSCMGCCTYREEEDNKMHEQLRIPPKGASDGLIMPSGMLAGVGLSSLDELMPLPQHQQSNDDWTMESLVEFLASPGCVSPPLPPHVTSDGQLDLEWLLDMYDVDMSHTNISGI